MPWKPPAVGSKAKQYDERWRRVRAQTLLAEPLCRLCLSAGKTVPATIVDHIVPLADGGTHAQNNLQPLCKRCHDAIKTPADAAAKRARDQTDISLRCVSLGHPLGTSLDLRVMRAQAARRMPWQQAHQFMLAAAEGILAARAAGTLPPADVSVVVDDAAWTKQAQARWQVPTQIDPLQDLPPAASPEERWLRERWSVEYGCRHGTTEQGPQPSIAPV
jgi:5-methylcytosine-specific restriction protein A